MLSTTAVHSHRYIVRPARLRRAGALDQIHKEFRVLSSHHIPAVSLMGPKGGVSAISGSLDLRCNSVGKSGAGGRVHKPRVASKNPSSDLVVVSDHRRPAAQCFDINVAE